MHLPHVSLVWYCQKTVYSRGLKKVYKRGRGVGNIGQIVFKRGVKPFGHYMDEIAQ